MENEEFSFVPTESVAKETPVAPVTVTDIQPTMQSAPAENPELKVKKKKSKVKFWLIFGISAVAVILTVVAIIVVTSLYADRYIEKDTDIVFFKTTWNEFIVCENGEKIGTNITGISIDQVSSLKGDTTLFTVFNFESNDNSEDLYCVYDGKVTRITEDHKGYRLAAEGNAALYVSGASALSKIDFKRDKTTYIADQVSDYEISPNGSAVAYTVLGYGMTSVYYFDGTESKLIDDDFPANTVILGLADNGNYIYMKSGGEEAPGSLFCYSRKDDKYTEICNNFAVLSCFNYNNTELAFTTTDNKTYFMKKDNDTKELYSETLTPVVTSGVGICQKTYGIKKLYDNFYSAKREGGFSDNLYYVDKDGGTTVIAGNIKSIKISSDGKNAYYLNDNDSLYKIKAKPNATGKVLATKVDAYELSVESDRIYFSTGYTLYYGYNELLSLKVSESVDEFCVIGDDVCVFSGDEGVFRCRSGLGLLFRTKESNRGISELDGFINSAYYLKRSETENIYELYGADEDGKFELIEIIDYSE